MRKHSPIRPPAGHLIRCAIYTRKSSEEGLEQEFNSLDAQREACEAYIKSQRHEGWTSLPGFYDDGGISGGTLERPALKRLLADIEARAVDTVVVYKVDRLTRSLNDFAHIVEVFDAHKVSFVSVTQQFNTTTSMGRLTLNMLLSFAQFEREVTGERIRDKIAASKKKGMWMGGLPPLGYRVQDRKLLVVEEEAGTVRRIYRRYAELGSVRLLKEELDEAGIVSKERQDRHGRRTGGVPLARGALYLMLQNRIYLGEIVHKGAAYPGEHAAIVEAALWAEVQQKLTENRMDRENGVHSAAPSLLAGLLFGDAGERLTPTHANKKGKRYRYYVSRRLITGTREKNPAGHRVPAKDIEALVEARLRQLLAGQAGLHAMLAAMLPEQHYAHELTMRAGRLSAAWPELPMARRRALLTVLIERIELGPEVVTLRIRTTRLPGLLREEGDPPEAAITTDAPPLALLVPARLRRVGMEMRLLIEGPAGQERQAADHSLHRMLAQAHRYQKLLSRGAGRTMEEIAAEAGVGRSYFTRILRLSFLAPGIVAAVLQDRHPPDLSAQRLAGDSILPLDWRKQHELLGVPETRQMSKG